MIAAIITRAWARIWPYIAAVGAVLAGLLAIRQSGKSAGRQEARIDQLEAEQRALEKARNVENETAAMDDDAVARESIDKWVRSDKRR